MGKSSIFFKFVISFFTVLVFAFLPLVGVLVSRHYSLTGGEYMAIIAPVFIIEFALVIVNIFLWKEK